MHYLKDAEETYIRRGAWDEADISLQPWPNVPLYLWIPPPNPNWADYTDTKSASSAASQLFVYPCNHSLASIYGTLVIFYIYPLRFLSRLISVLLYADILTHLWHPLGSLLQPQRNVFGYWSMTKIIIHFLIRAALAQQLASPVVHHYYRVCTHVCGPGMAQIVVT